MTRHLLDLMAPRSIAVVGASADPARFGGRAMATLAVHDYPGTVYPVNPGRSAIGDLRCYPEVRALPEAPDCAILTVGTERILPTLEQCAERGVKLAVVFGSGFAEVGPEGAVAQRRITELAADSGMRVMGPNCLGFLNTAARVAAAPVGVLGVPGLPHGDVSLVSQSGMLAFVGVFSRARDRGLGFRHVVATGNESDIDSVEVIDALLDDPGTRVVAAYIEGLRRPAAFRAVAAKARNLGKPLVLLKVGRSAAGAASAATHTASLSGSDTVLDAVLEAEAVLRVDELDDLWQLPPVLAHQPLPRGRRVAVIGTSGGLNSIVADELSGHGLELPPLGEATRARLGEWLPAYGSTANPVDITGYFAGADREDDYGDVVRIVDADDDVDAVVFAPGIDRAEFAEHAPVLAEKLSGATTTVLVVDVGGSVSAAGLAPLEGGPIPVLPSASGVARALAHGARYRELLAAAAADDTDASPVPQADVPAAEGQLGSEQAHDLLAAQGLPLVTTRHVRTPAEARAAAEELGGLVALKIDVPGLAHRSDAGAVALGVEGPDAEPVAQAMLERFEPDPRIRLVVQAMAGPGVEFLVGVQRDPVFGPVVVVGSGGVLVDLIADAAVVPLPVTRPRARRAVTSLRGAALLHGHRGKPALDVESLVDVVVGVGALASAAGDRLESLDLNPVIVGEHGSVVVDWLVVTRAEPVTTAMGTEANRAAP